MRRDMGWIDRGDHDNHITHFIRIACATPHDTKNAHPTRLRFIERTNDIRADISFAIASANGKHHNGIPITGVAGAKPSLEDRIPPFIIGAGCQFRNIVYRRISLNSAQFPEIVDGMRTVRRTTANTDKKQTPTTITKRNEFPGQPFDGIVINGGCDLRHLGKIGFCVIHVCQPMLILLQSYHHQLLARNVHPWGPKGKQSRGKGMLPPSG